MVPVEHQSAFLYANSHQTAFRICIPITKPTHSSIRFHTGHVRRRLPAPGARLVSFLPHSVQFAEPNQVLVPPRESRYFSKSSANRKGRLYEGGSTLSSTRLARFSRVQLQPSSSQPSSLTLMQSVSSLDTRILPRQACLMACVSKTIESNAILVMLSTALVFKCLACSYHSREDSPDLGPSHHRRNVFAL